MRFRFVAPMYWHSESSAIAFLTRTCSLSTAATMRLTAGSYNIRRVSIMSELRIPPLAIGWMRDVLRPRGSRGSRIALAIPEWQRTAATYNA